MTGGSWVLLPGGVWMRASKPMAAFQRRRRLTKVFRAADRDGVTLEVRGAGERVQVIATAGVDVSVEVTRKHVAAMSEVINLNHRSMGGGGTQVTSEGVRVEEPS